MVFNRKVRYLSIGVQYKIGQLHTSSTLPTSFFFIYSFQLLLRITNGKLKLYVNIVGLGKTLTSTCMCQQGQAKQRLIYNANTPKTKKLPCNTAVALYQLSRGQLMTHY
jgi:hypothetical protein